MLQGCLLDLKVRLLAERAMGTAPSGHLIYPTSIAFVYKVPGATERRYKCTSLPSRSVQSSKLTAWKQLGKEDPWEGCIALNFKRNTRSETQIQTLIPTAYGIIKGSWGHLASMNELSCILDILSAFLPEIPAISRMPTSTGWIAEKGQRKWNHT